MQFDELLIDGSSDKHPPATRTVSVGDAVAVLGDQDDISELAATWAASGPRTTTYRE